MEDRNSQRDLKISNGEESDNGGRSTYESSQGDKVVLEGRYKKVPQLWINDCLVQ